MIKRNAILTLKSRNSIKTFCQDSRKKTQLPILYGDEISPPVRYVLMTASAINFPIKFQKVDLFKSEQTTEWFKKINPLQKVPVLKTRDHFLCDSHAISLYMCDKTEHAIKDQIYPRDPLKRGLVYQMLFMNSGTFFPIDSFIFTEYFKGNWPVSEEIINLWYAALDYLDQQLRTNTWLAGNQMTLCDLCCGATVSSVLLLLPFLGRHANVKRWFIDLEHLDVFQVNKAGIAQLLNSVNAMK